MVHLGSASATNQVAILTGGAKGASGWPPPNVSRTNGCRGVLSDIELTRFDEAHAGFTPAMKQLVDVAMDAVEEAFAIPSRGWARRRRSRHREQPRSRTAAITNSWEYPVKEWGRVLAIDLTEVFYRCRSAIPHMIDCSWTAERIAVAADPQEPLHRSIWPGLALQGCRVLAGDLGPNGSLLEMFGYSKRGRGETTRQRQKWGLQPQASLNSRN